MELRKTKNGKAVFLDRDGVINELVYHQERGVIDSPFNVKQFRLLPGVGEAIRELNKAGYKVVLTSNQPGIAKGNFTETTFTKIRKRMAKTLAQEGAVLDGEYYCLHHPEAKKEPLKKECPCRKPKPGLLLKAAKDMEIDLSQSWIIGDNLTDVKAGKTAGVKTILLGGMKCELCHQMDVENARPDAVINNLSRAVNYILGQGG